MRRILLTLVTAGLSAGLLITGTAAPAAALLGPLGGGLTGGLPLVGGLLGGLTGTP